jgi:hypothetical protein
MLAGPKMFKGGRANVTRQYSGDTRFKRISPATVVVLIFVSCFEKIYWIP